MKSYNVLDRILIGIKGNPFQFLFSIFLAYSILWTILEPILLFLKSIVEPYLSGWLKFSFFIFISVLIGAYRVARPRQVILKHESSLIRIMFGDLFAHDGFKVTPVSRFVFETDIVATSLQNAVIRKFIESDEGIKGLNKYREKLSLALQNEPHEEKYRRATQQREKYYSLGTTALIELNDRNQFLLFAITETELKGHIPPNNSTVTKMWIALDKFWHEARKHSRGKAINIPLIGSGVTGISLSPIHVLELNLLAILNALTKEGKITTDEIRVILHEKYLEDIDLGIVKNIWEGKRVS